MSMTDTLPGFAGPSLADIAAAAALGASTAPIVAQVPVQPAAAADVVARADHDRLVAAARTEAATAERARIKAIMAHEEAAGRQTLAAHLAYETAMAPEACAPILKAAPKEAAAPSATALDKLKAEAPSFDLGNPAPADAAAAREASAKGWAKAVSAANASIGVK